jgi:DNA-binding winged helix-turn-helix (wHTH) protein
MPSIGRKASSLLREVIRANGSIVFEPAARRLSIDQRPLDLTTAEFEIVACLLHHIGRVVSRETLMRAAFGRAFNPLDRSVDVHVSHLRKKLGQHRQLIVTVRSVGYLFRLAVVTLVLSAAPAYAQTQDVEPRTVGGLGVNSIGVSGFIDKFMSSVETFPWHLTAHVDFTRFVSEKFAVRGGLIGATDFGGDEDEDSRVTGPGAWSLQAHGGLAYYFTPQSMASVYAGGEYRVPLTNRAEKDVGTVLGKGGVQAAISSRMSLFVEGGYGARLTRGTEDERQMRVVGELGVRIKF